MLLRRVCNKFKLGAITPSLNSGSQIALPFSLHCCPSFGGAPISRGLVTHSGFIPHVRTSLSNSIVREMSSLSGANTPKSQLERPFNQIDGTDVYVSHPLRNTEEQTNPTNKPPSVILICGWMDAQLPHIYKYTEKYHRLYPSATQILIRSHQKYFWKGEGAKRVSVFPAIKLLRDSDINPGDPAESSGLLVHTFSNGGALVLTSLARSMAESNLVHTHQSALPAQALLFDSLPGTVDLRVTILAFTAPIRSTPLRLLASVLFGAVYIIRKTWSIAIGAVLGKSPNMFERLHQELNDPRLLPQSVPRTYLYSDTDELIPVKSVEGHASRAKELLKADGLNPDLIKLVKFKGSKHVAHSRQDPQKYWATVVETWGVSHRK